MFNPHSNTHSHTSSLFYGFSKIETVVSVISRERKREREKERERERERERNLGEKYVSEGNLSEVPLASLVNQYELSYLS